MKRTPIDLIAFAKAKFPRESKSNVLEAEEAYKAITIMNNHALDNAWGRHRLVYHELLDLQDKYALANQKRLVPYLDLAEDFNHDVSKLSDDTYKYLRRGCNDTLESVRLRNECWFGGVR